MTRLTISKARETLSDTLNRVAYSGERVLLHRRGKDIAAVVSLEDLELLERLEDRLDIEAARKALKAISKSTPPDPNAAHDRPGSYTTGTVAWESLKAELGL